MSEYQIVKFRAVDRPLTDKQMEFMDRQSSRAEFTKWEFEVEYHYSSFGGNVDQMLRNGYDIFLTYSNYGCREVRMRLPGRLPFSKSVCSKYINAEGLSWTADKSGKSGILALAPHLEEAYEPVWAFDDYLDAIAKLREMLIVGDLRALYVLWLCNARAQATMMSVRWNRPYLMDCAQCQTKQRIFWPSFKLIHYLSMLQPSAFPRSTLRVHKMTQSMLAYEAH